MQLPITGSWKSSLPMKPLVCVPYAGLWHLFPGRTRCCVLRLASPLHRHQAKATTPTLRSRLVFLVHRRWQEKQLDTRVLAVQSRLTYYTGLQDCLQERRVQSSRPRLEPIRSSWPQNSPTHRSSGAMNAVIEQPSASTFSSPSYFHYDVVVEWDKVASTASTARVRPCSICL